MSLAQHFSAKKVPPNIIRGTALEIAVKIKTVANPSHIILFGSAADGDFRDGSDIDLLLVFRKIEDLQVARREIRKLGLLHPSIPVDLVFVSDELFHAKRNLGGICYIANHEGIRL